MAVESPKTLAEVPSYQEHLLTDTRRDGETALIELAAREFDPEMKVEEFAGQLALVSSEVEAVLDAIYSRVHGSLRVTEQMVGDFAADAGLGDVFDSAHAQPTLYRAVEDIRRAEQLRGRSNEGRAIHSGLNRLVFDSMFAAPSLYRGTEELRYATRGAQSGMLAGYDVRVFREAMQAPSLYRGQETIRTYAATVGEPAMRRGHDRLVRSEALGAPSLYRAIETVDRYSSSDTANEHMRAELNERVRSEALHAQHSSYRALETVRSYGYGAEVDNIEREVATKWLPEEQAGLDNSTQRLKEIEEKIEEFEGLSFFQRFFRINSRNSLRKEFRDTRAVVDMYQRSVDELKQILGSEEEPQA